ncbi:hypothetical protein D3C71_958580 [compost metagenome]
MSDRRLKPALKQERNHGDGLHQSQSQSRAKARVHINRVLDAVAPQNGGFTFSPARPPQSLTQARDRWRRSNLHNALDRSDVDAQLQGIGADGSGRHFLLLEGGLGLCSDLLG